jgi:hypothetical protein
VPENLDATTVEQFEAWLKTEILKLSVDTLKEQAVTCTACGEVLGTYIIDYKGERLRFSAERTYAFLKFLLESSKLH